MITPPCSTASAAPNRQSGFGLVQALLLVVAIGAALAAGALLLRAPQASRQAAAQEQTLAWADEAIAAFAARQSRLPCPAASANGGEDCAQGGKGWLPLASLAGASGTTGPAMPVRYMVYRGAGAGTDLAVAADRYDPLDLAGEPRGLDAVNGLDFCQALAFAASSPDPNAAHVADRAGNPLNVAFGLAAAGPTPGNGGRFDAGNGGTAPVMESPARNGDAGYDDRVRVRDFAGLAQVLGCPPLGTQPDNIALAAMDTLSTAVAVADTTAELQESNIGNTKVSLDFAIIAETLGASNILVAGGQTANATSTLITVTASLARAIATCIASLGITCAEVAVKAAALALAIASVASSVVAVGLNVGALIPTTESLQLTQKAHDMANADSHGNGSTVDLDALAADTCTSVKGGMAQEVDAGGNLVYLDPPGNQQPKMVWKDGLKQQSEHDAQAAANAIAARDALQGYLAQWQDDSFLDGLLDLDTLSQPSKYRDQAIFDSDGNLVRYDYKTALMLADLKAKRDKVYAYQQAQLAYDQAKAEEDSALQNLQEMRDAAVMMAGQVQTRCAATDDVSKVLCQSSRDAYALMTTCVKPGSTVPASDANCIPNLEARASTATSARASAGQARTAARNAADGQDSPVLDQYCYDAATYDCTDQIFIPGQSDGDRRATYGTVVHNYLTSTDYATRMQQQALDSRKAYEDGVEQCNALTELAATVPETVVPTGRWQCSGEILRTADDNGAVGRDRLGTQDTGSDTPDLATCLSR